MKRILIDGTNLSQIHFAANPAVDHNGNPVGIIKGFLSAVRNINQLLRPDQIIVFFDGGGGSLQRRSLYKEYKEGRKPRVIAGQHYQFGSEEQAKKNYDWQLQVLKKLLDCCAINVIETENYEADDGIAYVLSLYPNDEHVIVSCDKDFYQLITDKNKIYNPLRASGGSQSQQKGKLIGAEDVLKQYKIHPTNWLFYRAITGDVSDNIPGVKGFGAKTLQKLFLLNREKSLKVDLIAECVSIMEEVDKLDNKEKTTLKKLKILLENKERIERNWKLMDLKNPLMPSNSKEQINFQINSFKPLLKMKDFFVEAKILGGVVNPTLVNEFSRLKKYE